MRRPLVAALVAILGCVPVACAGVASRALGPATNGRDGALSRYAGPNILQQNDGAQFVEFPTDCHSLGPLSRGADGTSMWFTEPKGCGSGHSAVASIAIATGIVHQYAL